jgi:hypothetical protein
MYESPITQVLGEMQITYENECLKAVQSYGFDVNKEELTKALQYDREQYTKGHKDGYEKAVADFVEAVKEEYPLTDWALYAFHRKIEDIAQELRGVTP